MPLSEKYSNWNLGTVTNFLVFCWRRIRSNCWTVNRIRRNSYNFEGNLVDLRLIADFVRNQDFHLYNSRSSSHFEVVDYCRLCPLVHSEYLYQVHFRPYRKTWDVRKIYQTCLRMRFKPFTSVFCVFYRRARVCSKLTIVCVWNSKKWRVKLYPGTKVL